MLQSYFYSKTAQGITLAVLAVALIAFYFVVISDEKAIYQDSSKRMEEEQLTIRMMEVQLGKAKRACNLYDRNLEEITYFRSNFLQQKDERLRKISKFLVEKAKERRIDLDRVSYQKTASPNKDMEIQLISLPLVGKYRDIRTFVGDVESSDLFLIINQLSLEDEQGRTGIVEVELTLATYFQGGGS